MAHVQHNGEKFPLKAASNVAAKVPVAQDTTENQVVPISSAGQQPIGFTIAIATRGEAVAVYGKGNVVKALAAASLGNGAVLGVATTGGQLSVVSGASGTSKWSVGESREDAAAGDTFSLYVNPRQLSNLA